MIEYFNKFIKDNSDGVVIGGFMFVTLFAIIGVSSCASYNEEQRQKEETEKRSKMTKDEVIKYDASKSFCTKRSGSRPSCWKKTDWDLFFLEYCNRLPHQCENNGKKE